jgi:uncharacterized membrane protein YkvA (DUF1232 family)
MGEMMTMEKEDTLPEEKFRKKMANMPIAAGCAILRTAVTLYVLLRKPETPLWAKAFIIAALTYWILPIDTIPDLIIGIGYTDDLAVMSLALSQLQAFQNEAIRKEVSQQLPKLCQEKVS